MAVEKNMEKALELLPDGFVVLTANRASELRARVEALEKEKNRYQHGAATALRMLERRRIWGGMGWKWNDMPADAVQRTHEAIDAAMKAEE